MKRLTQQCAAMSIQGGKKDDRLYTLESSRLQPFQRQVVTIASHRSAFHCLGLSHIEGAVSGALAFLH